LLALLTVPVVVLGSTLAGRYYYGSLSQSPSLEAEDPDRGMSTQPAERTIPSAMPTQSRERIDLDGFRNGKIAFSQEVEMPSAFEQAVEKPDEPIVVREPDIWTVNPNGSNPVQLTANSRDWDESPAWSPNGKRIAFVNKDPVADQPNLAGRIYIMDPDGSDRIEISPPKGESVYDPSWSPDGQRIAFSSQPSCDIFLANAGGTGTPKKLTTPGFLGCAVGQEWSPDGTQMAFQGYVHDSSWADIYVMNVSPQGGTSELRRLTDFRMDDKEAAWSPDGTEIAFTSNRVPQWEIYKVDVKSLKVTRLTHSPLSDTEPTWSPDGEHIAYVKQKLERSTHASIYKMHSDGSNSTSVFEEEGEYAHNPDWAPWSPTAQGKPAQ
jgi:Tol biopolymer transport system component